MNIAYTLFCSLSLSILLVGSQSLSAQRSIVVGKGSYAEYTPLEKSKSDQHGGFESYAMEHRKLYLTPQAQGRPVPTNDWWTSLLVNPYSGNMWAYPLVVSAQPYGVAVEYPKTWTADYREMKSVTRLELHGRQFAPPSADANCWHDWGLDFEMRDGNKGLKTTLAHGIPFVWIELSNLVLQLRADNATFWNGNEQVELPYIGSHLCVRLGDDDYGVYVPENSTFQLKNGLVEVLIPPSSDRSFLVVGALPSKERLADFASYAYFVPRDTKVAWNYDEPSGKLSTTWEVQTEDVRTGASGGATLQGFIPHHYKRSTLDFSFEGTTYACPRGLMKMAAGNRFTIAYDFNGITPYFPRPLAESDRKNPYDRSRMVEQIRQYADKGGFGADTYWGGKGLTQMALYMTFAHEMGETELFERCKGRLREALVNWYTYTPGEPTFYFSRYNRWRGLVGMDASYGSDTFNDHHFHYGYFTYASALLSLFDDDFRQNYAPMSTLLAKDYANWERNDSEFPFFRTFDPWAGHSYAGGLGDGNGNGQESTSEAMQGWGGLFFMGVATGNRAMRDAGIFGWELESRGTAEYWFDRDRENIDYSRYDKPYNSNLTSQGIGWWTWFSGDPVWMHSIQWMPISPILKYLYRDLHFAAWDYDRMWRSKEVGDWEAPKGLGQESGLGNVVLSYLQIADPDSAASVFDRLWAKNYPMVKNADTGGISYYITHSHRSYGEIQWDVHADLPTATAYRNGSGDYTYTVYNPDEEERLVTFRREAQTLVSFKAPARRLTVYGAAPKMDSVRIVTPSRVVPPGGSLPLRAEVLDQYGATLEVPVVWSVEGQGTIDRTSGRFSAAGSKGEAVVKATCGERSAVCRLRIDDLPVVASSRVLPEKEYAETSESIGFELELIDQYGDPYPSPTAWSIWRGDEQVASDSVLTQQPFGLYTVRATVEGCNYERTITLLPQFPNLALGKKCVASSEENVGTPVVAATDGNLSTRWSSRAADNEWVYVDLDETVYAAYLAVHWEAAYASRFRVEVASVWGEWTVVDELAGQPGEQRVPIERTVRYIRLTGLQRATAFGISLWELEVYGIPSENQDVLWGLEITPREALLKQGVKSRLSAIGYNGLGKEVEVSPVWSIVSGEGTIESDGSVTPSSYGTLVLKAEGGGKSTTRSYAVEEGIRLTHIEVSPQKASLVLGDSQTITSVASNQFGSLMSVGELSYKLLDGEGVSFDGNRLTALAVGSYRLVVGNADFSIADTVRITVGTLVDSNLALNKPTTASGYENQELTPQRATDGDGATRWSSLFKDGEYLQIDLQKAYVLNRIKLFWQQSYATSYRVELSLDADSWTTVCRNDQCKGGDEELSFDPTAGRYVRITCLKRSSGYGASLWEVEAYGTSEYDAPVPTSVVVEPDPLFVYLGERLPLAFKVLDQYGLDMQVEVSRLSLQLSGGGTVSAEGVVTPERVGQYELTVGYGGLIVRLPIEVREQRRLTSIDVSVDRPRMRVGETLRLTARAVDQYGNPMNVPLLFDATSGTIDGTGLFTATALGRVVLGAAFESVRRTIEIEVVDASVNLALRKPATASSGTASAAVDGNNGTRWESLFSDPQWIAVDLQRPYALTNIEIVWEAASAADYRVECSLDGEVWSVVRSFSDLSGARTDSWTLGETARYVRVYGTRRTMPYGYSIWELRLYGVAVEDPNPPVSLSGTADDSPVRVIRADRQTEVVARSIRQIELFDLSGKLRYSESFGNDRCDRVLLPSLPSGSYLLRVVESDRETRMKVLMNSK